MSTNNRAALDIKRDLQQLKGDDGEYVLSNLASMYGLPKLVEYIDALLRQAEREARVDELKTLTAKHSRTYQQTVTDSTGNVYVSDSHGYISKYETQERIAALVALQVGPQGASEGYSGPQVGGEQVMRHTSEPTEGSL